MHTPIRSNLLVRLPAGPSALLRKEDGLDVRQHAALGDRHAGQQLVQLLVVPKEAQSASAQERNATK